MCWPPLAELAGIAWVALRPEIDYLRAALEGDRISLRTRVGTALRMTFERHTEIVRSRDGQVLAKARTLWCPIDSPTGRLRGIGPGLRERVAIPAGEPAD
ncbi:MAG: acyl-CoA thioesterase [Limisphaerales bacterium]